MSNEYPYVRILCITENGIPSRLVLNTSSDTRIENITFKINGEETLILPTDTEYNRWFKNEDCEFAHLWDISTFSADKHEAELITLDADGRINSYKWRAEKDKDGIWVEF